MTAGVPKVMYGRNNPCHISFRYRAARPGSAEWMAESLCHGPADAEPGLPATWRHQGSQELSCTCPIAACKLSVLGHVQGFAREWLSFQSLPWSAPKFFPATLAFRPPYSVWTVCLDNQRKIEKQKEKERKRKRERERSSTFQSISGFALPSRNHNNQSLLLVSYFWNFRHRLVRYYWYIICIIYIPFDPANSLQHGKNIKTTRE